MQNISRKEVLELLRDSRLASERRALRKLLPRADMVQLGSMHAADLVRLYIQTLNTAYKHTQPSRAAEFLRDELPERVAAQMRDELDESMALPGADTARTTQATSCRTSLFYFRCGPMQCTPRRWLVGASLAVTFISALTTIALALHKAGVCEENLDFVTWDPATEPGLNDSNGSVIADGSDSSRAVAQGDAQFAVTPLGDPNATAESLTHIVEDSDSLSFWTTVVNFVRSTPDDDFTVMELAKVFMDRISCLTSQVGGLFGVNTLANKIIPAVGLAALASALTLVLGHRYYRGNPETLATELAKLHEFMSQHRDFATELSKTPYADIDFTSVRSFNASMSHATTYNGEESFGLQYDLEADGYGDDGGQTLGAH